MSNSVVAAFTILVLTTVLCQVSGRTLSNQIDSDSESNSLETIMKNYGDRIEKIDIELLFSGLEKYSSLSSSQRQQLVSGSTPEERLQANIDVLIINFVLNKDPVAKQLLEDLHNKKYKSGSEEELRLIRKLDAKFANTPAWGRHWKRIMDSLAEFYETYG